jgi:flagellum-specific peptidoglycan hydrolase FlgJ
LLFALSLKAQSIIQKVENYIDAHKEYAIEQMVLFKIPASVTMAQAIKESGYGTSVLANECHNHFGIKCHKEWGGDSYSMEDDTLDECFRKYKSTEDSFYDHSMFLASRPRYAPLFNLGLWDYKGWCVGLKEAGYATSVNYTNDLLVIINTFHLYELDVAARLNTNLKLDQLLATSEKNIIPCPENYITTAEKLILAKVIFNLPTAEEPLLVRANPSENKGD